MGFLKIIKTISPITDLLVSNDKAEKLEEYVGNKMSDFIDNIDGTNEERAIALRDSQLEELRELLNDDDFDNDSFQESVDYFISNYALEYRDGVIALYYGALGWSNDFNLFDDNIGTEEYHKMSEDEQENLLQARNNANEQVIKRVDEAFDICREDEELLEEWICTLWTMKAVRLHWMGKHVEAVRLAIRALSYACDEDEKANAKRQITGIPENVQECNWTTGNRGYGINGMPIEKRIEMAWEEDKPCYNDNMTDAEKKEFEDFCQELFEADKDAILHGQYTFSNRPYHDRQFIFTVRDLDHIGGCYDETDTIQYVFPLNEVPGDITFPVGHPLSNTLYYAHPLRPYYMPFEKAQLMLLYEKVQEICRLFQCLGATEITTRCLKGEKISNNLNYSDSIDGQVNYKVTKASGGMDRKMSSQESQSRKDDMSLTQTFSPTQPPYCPDDLLWTKSDPELLTLIKQRLEGGMLSFSKKVSSYETADLSMNQINDIKGAFEALMVNVSANYSSTSDTTFSSTNETEWEIDVVFKPLDEFKQIADADSKPSEEAAATLTGNSDAEEEYKEEYLFYVENGEISDKERRLLERKRIKLGISEEKAKEIEQSLSGQLTAEELQYEEEVLFFLEDDGMIDEQERKILERKRIKFGISEARAAEIEQLCMSQEPPLTEEEQEYIDTYKDLVSDGVVSDRERRILERQRKLSGISEDRAKKLESMI